MSIAAFDVRAHRHRFRDANRERDELRSPDAAVYSPSNPRIGALAAFGACRVQFARPGGRYCFAAPSAAAMGLKDGSSSKWAWRRSFDETSAAPPPRMPGTRMQDVGGVAGEKRHDVAGRDSRRRVVLLHRAFGADRLVVEDERRKLPSARRDRTRRENSTAAAAAAADPR